MHLKWAPKNTPAANEHAESALNCHAVGALVEVEVRVVDRGDHAVRGGESIVAVQEKRRRELSVVDSGAELGARPRERVVRRGGVADVVEGEPAVGVANGNTKKLVTTLPSDVVT